MNKWHLYKDKTPDNLSIIKFIAPRYRLPPKTQYVMGDDLRGVFIGQFWGDASNGLVCNLDNTTSYKADEYVEKWAYLDLSGPSN